MRISGLRGLWKAARRTRNRFPPRAFILLYHRVAQLPSDPYHLCVTPQHFTEHLEVLRNRSHPLRLQELTQALQDREVPRSAVVITFDDGYADNLHNAKPLLERYDTPATIFVASGYLGREREFWWDELDRLLLQTQTLPETLRMSINGRTYQRQLGNKDDHTLRKDLLHSLHRLLRPLPDKEQQKVLDGLVKWAGVQSVGRSTHRALTIDEVYRLAGGGLVEIGAHTVTHPVLSALSETEQRLEIESSKHHLEELMGHSVSSFAYPYGLRSDYRAETVAIVRESEFTCACSNFAGVVGRRTDRFQLPRIMVLDWDGDEFARHLGECTG